MHTQGKFRFVISVLSICECDLYCALVVVSNHIALLMARECVCTCVRTYLNIAACVGEIHQYLKHTHAQISVIQHKQRGEEIEHIHADQHQRLTFVKLDHSGKCVQSGVQHRQALASGAMRDVKKKKKQSACDIRTEKGEE